MVKNKVDNPDTILRVLVQISRKTMCSKTSVRIRGIPLRIISEAGLLDSCHKYDDYILITNLTH